MFIITREINAYDQDGEYFEVAFNNIPTLSELSTYFYKLPLEKLSDEQLLFLAHIRNNGGRRGFEGEWYNSYELKSGQGLNEKEK